MPEVSTGEVAENSEPIDIQHGPASNFSGYYASDVALVVHGNQAHLIFYRDVPVVVSERAAPTGKAGEYHVIAGEMRTVLVREDQCRVSLPESSLRRIADILNKRLDSADQ